MTDERLFKIVLDDMVSPFQKFKFKVGEKYVCDDFDPNPENECSRGFYATGIEGLTYSYRPGRRIFEVAVGGKNVNVDPIFKRRWEYMELVREVFQDEIIDLAKAHEPRCGYLLSEAIFPVNPLTLPPPKITDDVIALANNWGSVLDSVLDSVRGSVLDSVMGSAQYSVWVSVRGSVLDSVGDCVMGSVRDSVRDSVLGSVGDCVMGSVRDSVRDSVLGSVLDSVRGSVLGSVGDCVWASVGAYIGSLFPGISTWKYIQHEPGVYPFQPAADLWRMGLVPIYDGKIWRLLAGTKAEIVWEGK